MAIRIIREEGDDVLRKKCREVTDFNEKLHTLIDDMIETMHDAGGVGLAAPQVGILKRVVKFRFIIILLYTKLQKCDKISNRGYTMKNVFLLLQNIFLLERGNSHQQSVMNPSFVFFPNTHK